MKTKPNAFVMVDAIKEEVTAAAKEGRIPRSSNVIAKFRNQSKAQLSNDQVSALFEIVFQEFQNLTGSQIMSSFGAQNTKRRRRGHFIEHKPS